MSDVFYYIMDIIKKHDSMKFQYTLVSLSMITNIGCLLIRKQVHGRHSWWLLLRILKKMWFSSYWRISVIWQQPIITIKLFTFISLRSMFCIKELLWIVHLCHYQSFSSCLVSSIALVPFLCLFWMLVLNTNEIKRQWINTLQRNREYHWILLLFCIILTSIL